MPRSAARLDPAERRARLLADRFAPGLLVSEDGSLLALAVRPQELENSLQRLDIETAFKQALADDRACGHLVAMSGQTPLDAAQLRATIRDSLIFVPATLTIGLVLIAWLFRRWLALAIALAVIHAGVGTALLMLVLLGQPFTLITAILSPLMVSLSVAFLLHWYNALAMAERREGAERCVICRGRVLTTARATGLGCDPSPGLVLRADHRRRADLAEHERDPADSCVGAVGCGRCADALSAGGLALAADLRALGSWRLGAAR